MKRRLTKLVVFLLLGAVVNVAVAWGLLLNIPQGYEFQVRSSTGYELATVLALKAQYLDADTWPATKQRVEIEVAYEAYLCLEPKFITAPQGFEYTGAEYSDHGWRIVVIYASYSIYSRYATSRKHWISILDSMAKINLVGWPLPFIGDIFLEIKGPDDSTFWVREKRFVEWPKFLAGTVCWATVVALLSCSLQTAQRIYRKRRGECLVCGYDLRETSGGCPECGWGREAEE